MSKPPSMKPLTRKEAYAMAHALQIAQDEIAKWTPGQRHEEEWTADHDKALDSARFKMDRHLIARAEDRRQKKGKAV